MRDSLFVPVERTMCNRQAGVISALARPPKHLAHVIRRVKAMPWLSDAPHDAAARLADVEGAKAPAATLFDPAKARRWARRALRAGRLRSVAALVSALPALFSQLSQRFEPNCALEGTDFPGVARGHELFPRWTSTAELKLIACAR